MFKHGRSFLLSLLFAFGAVRAQAADPVRLGLLHTLSPAPFYIAQERGYFRDEGIDLTFRFFDSAQPIAAAAVAGDIDVGVTALTGGFFNLAEKGTLKVIGGALHEEKFYEGSAILASDKAYAAGLTDLAHLPGHSFAITQYGSSFHYMLGRIAEAEHFDLKSVSLRPVQQTANMIAAVTSGQADATIAISSVAKPLAATGRAHILAWAGDIVPYQITAVFTTTAMIKDHAGVLKRFAAAYQHGVADYRDAFLRRDAAGHPIIDAKTDTDIPLLNKYVFVGDPKARQKILDGVGYYDAGGALDVQDLAAQVRWFRAQGLVKGDADPATMMDTQFLPTR
ncbi:MAG TPA: ABC transporter substrate-binding protein [Rhodopila sp.]|nr:ABC transporter substrate-binding protein [Rhodopila sp.]